MVDQNGPRPERYAEAVKVLARLHGTALPGVLPVAEGRDHVLPPYDREALLFEAELLPEWYAPFVANSPLAPAARASFVAPGARRSTAWRARPGPGPCATTTRPT